jgi:hypothetical protein
MGAIMFATTHKSADVSDSKNEKTDLANFKMFSYLPGGSAAESPAELKLFLGEFLQFGKSRGYEIRQAKAKEGDPQWNFVPDFAQREKRLELPEVLSMFGLSPNLAKKSLPRQKSLSNSPQQPVADLKTDSISGSPTLFGSRLTMVSGVQIDATKAVGLTVPIVEMDKYLFDVLKGYVSQLGVSYLSDTTRRIAKLNEEIKSVVPNGDNYNFVIMPKSDNDKTPVLRIGLKKHCFLSQGKPVYAAGTMRFSEGKLIGFNASSGGYKPDDESFLQAVKMFNKYHPEMQLPLDKFEFGAAYANSVKC